jgi:hypothetical protein
VVVGGVSERERQGREREEGEMEKWMETTIATRELETRPSQHQTPYGTGSRRTAVVAGDKQRMMQKKEREGREAREQQRQRGQRAIRVRRAWRVGQWYEDEVSGKRAGKWLELGWVCLQSVVYAPDPASHGGMPGTGETGTTGNHEEDQGPLTHSQETDVVLQGEGRLVGWLMLFAFLNAAKLDEPAVLFLFSLFFFDDVCMCVVFGLVLLMDSKQPVGNKIGGTEGNQKPLTHTLGANLR